MSQSETSGPARIGFAWLVATHTVSEARRLTGPSAQALADLTAIFDDLQFVLGCCERLLRELAKAEHQDPVLVESLWAAALNAYARCFRSGDDRPELTVDDVTATGLEGDVIPWHESLGKLRNFLVAKAANPREVFSVGVSVSEQGRAEGIVVSSIPLPGVDENTVRQTGRMAYELGRLVDGRIQETQKALFAEVKDMPAARISRLDKLPVDFSPTAEPDD
ncbi:hypothetical protein EV186_103969 [Labedaea rhizosphaerae]|uniref:Uncharacterized protein n=1 Tax=Labedaea rhizosphaerae TaxID=598644 RepID=A0A4R6SD26_LABRH|nr:hypothetical protein EV186_103969 [Labedaea rhizosphaerae]